MQLSKLLEALTHYKLYGTARISIKRISDDSRKVRRGDLFVAIKGMKVDAHRFIPEAIEKGASVVVGERNPELKWLEKITYVKVKNTRKSLALLALAFYGNPSKKLKVIGVTGTDGKTTTASLIYWLLRSAGKKVGLISTVGAKIGSKKYDTGLHVTNPEPILLHKLLKKMTKAKCEYAVIEVTSHGLDQDRVAGIEFEVGVLTNITHEHLDYHRNFSEYKKAKAKLFSNLKLAAVLNRDDDSFDYLNSLIKTKKNGKVKIISYGVKNKKSDVLGVNPRSKHNLEFFDVRVGDLEFGVKTRLLGTYNVMNILASIAVGLFFKLTPEQIQKALLTFRPPPGRLEKVSNKKGVDIFIDFAHTPNALSSVLSLFAKRSGRLICVFGCAGERDVGKRPIMGSISVKLADFSIFTAEDPRGERVEDIIGQMKKGALEAGGKNLDPDKYRKSIYDSYKKGKKEPGYFLAIPERGEAISFAIQKLAKSGDVVLICGKGHERSMAYEKVEFPWSDHQAVSLALRGGIKRIKRN